MSAAAYSEVTRHKIMRVGPEGNALLSDSYRLACLGMTLELCTDSDANKLFEQGVHAANAMTVSTSHLSLCSCVGFAANQDLNWRLDFCCPVPMHASEPETMFGTRSPEETMSTDTVTTRFAQMFRPFSMGCE